MKESRECFQIAPPRARKIENRPWSEEQTEHRTDSIKRDVGLRTSATGRICCGGLNGTSSEFFELRAKLFQQFPSVDAFEFTQLHETRSHRQRIARQRARLVNGAIWRKLVHDFGSPAECADWQSAANYFP